MWWPVHPLRALEEARGTLFPWVPVLLAIGIGLWFRLPAEPAPVVYASLAAGAGVVLAALGLWRDTGRPLLTAGLCLLIGPLAAGLRAHLADAPVLPFRYYGPIEGRVIGIDRSQSDDVRLTLDRVVLERFSPDATPERVRLSLHGADRPPPPAPGSVVIVTGHLSPPPGPSEPGGFDFRRMAYFERLGAVGYTRTPLLLLERPEAGALPVEMLRARLSAAIMAAWPGQAGAFAAGAVTGDRSGITQDTVAALRDSNLSHLLAISGMNMAFITGFVFAVVRYGLALVPPLALRVDTKKVAALIALAAAAFYLALSGANVATERAFVMVSIMLVAILADRRAISLRSVAMAAIVLLVARPESLLSPGFQMSFAATTVLIAGFGLLDRAVLREKVPRWTMPVFTLVLSSVLAGIATAPVAAAHFNRFTDYGLLANLLTVPAMGLLIMPGAVVAALLAPVGLQVVGIWMMGAGSAWILAVAQWIAGLEGAVTGIPMPRAWVLPVLSLAGLWLILWRGHARWLAVLPLAAALGGWVFQPRPLALVSGDGALVGVLGPEGRAMSAPRGAGFAATSWLENDGDLADQAEAALRPGFSGPNDARSFSLGPLRAVHLRGRGGDEGLADACRDHDLVILSVEAAAAPARCRVIDRAELSRTGTLAIRLGGDGAPSLMPTEGHDRLWTRRGPGPGDQ